MAKSSSSSSGIGFTGALTITFIVLKLCKVITWSWIWVLSPLWITTVTCIIILAVFNISYVLLRKQYNQSIKKENNIQANKPKKKLGFQQRMEEIINQQKHKQNIKL